MTTIWHHGPAFFERQVFDANDQYPGIRAWRYAIGLTPPNYPVPALDYYNSLNPDHMPIGYMMEWSIPVDVQLKYRG